ncbi:hypothetical protein OU787_05110 [Kitasatospora sp. YST-16]|uniref:hypothetical protein n=1 Tax=Kitasatospora sp. YST-16 TaxID=2998080 RepID=UPI0022839563|nr:hypothetical protein [Kitasatospora sp. YST-16]WAL70928.1 hypothetical protein OU787_05110 [Kitasatospora sp. YST-16]WNW36965.1 hypothetical protein RKE32_05080 [Streptomyces sp. Li-HN-5-13]
MTTPTGPAAPAAPPMCPAHGPGPDLAALVGRRLTGVVASWYSHEGERAADPVVVWLRDDRGGCTFVGTGSDWCLIVAEDRPHADVDLGEWGRLDVRDAPHDTPFAPHLGHPVLAAREEHTPLTGRTALELDFPGGTVRCESWDGDLRLTATGDPR